jgi:hypothetical protein
VPVALADDPALTDLARELRAIADLLDRWRMAGAGEAPHREINRIAKHFANIHTRLSASGERGERLRRQLGPIATNLRAAADALAKSGK